MKDNGSRLLPAPRVEVCRVGGIVQGVTVRLRTGKARRDVESDPEVFVSIAVDALGRPVVVHFSERRDPLAVYRDLLDLVVRSTAPGDPDRRRFAGPAFTGRLHRALRRAHRLLPAQPVLSASGR